MCADNLPLWRAVLEGRSWSNAPTWGYACGVFLLLVATYYALLAVCAVRALLKPVLIASLIAGAVVAYYIGRYNVVFDAAMMSNVLHTDAHEAIELIDAESAGARCSSPASFRGLFVMLTNVRLRSWRHAPGSTWRARRVVAPDRGDLCAIERISEPSRRWCVIGTRFGIC